MGYRVSEQEDAVRPSCNDIHNKIRKETHPSLVGEGNCASYDVVIVVDSSQFPVTDRVG